MFKVYRLWPSSFVGLPGAPQCFETPWLSGVGTRGTLGDIDPLNLDPLKSLNTLNLGPYTPM